MYFIKFRILIHLFRLECETKCTAGEEVCGLELFNFDNKCVLDCENEKIEALEKKIEPLHGSACNGNGIYSDY